MRWSGFIYCRSRFSFIPQTLDPELTDGWRVSVTKDNRLTPLGRRLPLNESLFVRIDILPDLEPYCFVFHRVYNH